MKELKEPCHPYPPMAYDFRESDERKSIYKYYEVLADFDGQEFEDWRQEHTHPEKSLDQIDLSWILQQIPEGIDPSQVKIEIGCEDRYQEDHHIEFYYIEKTPARKKDFKLAQEKYKKDLIQYEKDMEVYRATCREQEIKELEEKLSYLKSWREE